MHSYYEESDDIEFWRNVDQFGILDWKAVEFYKQILKSLLYVSLEGHSAKINVDCRGCSHKS